MWSNRDEYQSIMLDERSQSQVATECIIPTMRHSGQGKNCSDRKEISGCPVAGSRGEQTGCRGVLGK